MDSRGRPIGRVRANSDGANLYFSGSTAPADIRPGEAVVFERGVFRSDDGDTDKAIAISRLTSSIKEPEIRNLCAASLMPEFWALVAADHLEVLSAPQQLDWLNVRLNDLARLPDHAWSTLKPEVVRDIRIWNAAPSQMRKEPESRARTLLEEDYIGASERFRDAPLQYPPPEAVYKLRTALVKGWAKDELDLDLDDEQAATVAAVEGDVQVVARAGSGKTRALVTRAIFLQKHCKVHPRQMLLLAFNKKAAEEMRNRLEEVLGDDVPHVMTFHALAYALIHPEEELVYDDISADQLGVSREVQDVIDEHIRSGNHGKVIKELMLAHFREDWERIEEGRFKLPMHEFLDHRRSLPRETLNGEYVKSFGEKLIANTLFEHGIEYRYESNFRWNGTNYRPDFLIGKRDEGGIVIEYFGLEGDADYDELSEHKREFWAIPERAAKWKFLEYDPSSITDGGLSAFVNRLVADLRNFGLVPTRLTEEEIWQRIRRRAVDSFTKAMRQFVGRCRKHDLSEDELANQISGHVSCSQSEELFLRIGKSVYCGYMQRLAEGGKEDFDGLMWRAERAVREGLTRFVRNKGKEQGDLKNLRFAMVDEFQDFSEMFSRLLGAIRAQNPAVNFFCVGDDWQAINSFAGSDLQYFETFQERFRRPSRFHITTNWRSHRAIVEAGNAIMRGLGEPARVHVTAGSGECLVGRLSDFTPTGAEERQHEGDELTPAVLRIVSWYLNRGKDVVLLSRRNGLPWYVKYLGENRADGIEKFQEHVRSFLPEEDRRRVTASTAHKYKGLEKQAVVVLDALARSYPLVHPHWVFLRVFGDGVDRIVAEERRLYYVALTRAVESVVLLTDGGRETPFLADMQGTYADIDWPRLRPVAAMGDGVVEVRVHNAYDVKDQLKALGYKWAGQRNAANKYWHRIFRADSFDFERDIRGQDWARHEGVIVGAYAEDGELIHGQEPEAQRQPQRFVPPGPAHRMIPKSNEYDSNEYDPFSDD